MTPAIDWNALETCRVFFAEDMPNGPDAAGIEGFATVDYRHAYRKMLVAIAAARDPGASEGGKGEA
jgi:hypothetical protein